MLDGTIDILAMYCHRNVPAMSFCVQWIRVPLCPAIFFFFAVRTIITYYFRVQLMRLNFRRKQKMSSIDISSKKNPHAFSIGKHHTESSALYAIINVWNHGCHYGHNDIAAYWGHKTLFLNKRRSGNEVYVPHMQLIPMFISKN